MAMRKVIAHELGVPLPRIHPNDQYSGGADNLDVHRVLEPLLQTYSLDRTIIEDDRADYESVRARLRSCFAAAVCAT